MQSGVGSRTKHIDLHIHTKYSDGSLSEQEVVDMAFQKNLKAIAITDHDCIDAYPLAQKLGSELDIEVIPAVELSSEIEGMDIHILGYYIDDTNEDFIRKLAEMKRARYKRAKKMVENLNDQGTDLRFETVLNIAGKGAVGRPHIAAALLKEELVYSFREAFDKYIGYDSPAYVKKMILHPKEVFDLIREANGLPILAHPGVTKVNDRLDEFMRDGLAGLEVYHSEHSQSQTRHYLRFCKTHDLSYSGGSDFHSIAHYRAEIGVPRVPYNALKSLKEKHQSLS
ncbi:MAG: PHP domain-containing protein [Chitinivibrionales bacterium]|nr:PHP domain-containing protein [Chitinivibrionales bacterium]